MPLAESRLVRRQAAKAFAECDLDNDGQLSVLELHVGLLRVYDKLNDSLPVHLKPPSHAEVRALLKRHDVDGSGELSADEFLACVKELLGVGERRRFTQSITFQVVSRSLAKLLVLPLTAALIKRGVKRAGGEEVAKRVPDAALVLAVEMAANLGILAYHKLGKE